MRFLKVAESPILSSIQIAIIIPAVSASCGQCIKKEHFSLSRMIRRTLTTLNRFQRLERSPRVPGDMDRSLTISRKQIKLKHLLPFTLPHQGGGWVGREYFTHQEDKFIESPGHWRHGIYRKPCDRSAHSKRSTSPMSDSKNQRFEVADRSSHRIRSW